MTSLESTLDRATESYALAVRRQLHARQRGDGNVAPIDQTAALALVKAPTFHVGQLRWKGAEVSDEFLRYAARVARGEQLAPYRGQVLARASVDFPWHSELHGHTDGPTHPTEPRVRRRKHGRKLLGWARGAGALVICMLLVGAGAAAMSGGTGDARPPWTLHLAEPAHAATPQPPAFAAGAAEPTPSAAPSGTAEASERTTEQKLRPKTRATRQAPRRRALLTPSAPPAQSTLAPSQAESAVSVPSATSIEPARAQSPVEPARPADTRVITVVGSTVLPPLDEVARAPAASPLLLEAPPF